MKHLLAVVLTALIPVDALATDATQPAEEPLIQTAGDRDLSEFLWIKRPVIVFANSAADPRFAEQMELLSAGIADLEERDVIVLTDTDPAAASPLRQKLRPRGFMLALVGKDGGVKLRKPLPWDVRELSRSIDKMPMREREIRERRATDG